MKKRIISLLLTLVLAVSLLPVSAVAETDVGLDLSKFTFTLSSQATIDERYQYNAVTVAKKADGTYSLTAPTYAVSHYSGSSKTALTIKAPADLGKEFSVTYFTWDNVGENKTEKTATSVNGSVTLDSYYNPLPSGFVEGSLQIRAMEYSDLVFRAEGSQSTSKASFSLFNNLRGIIVNCTDKEIVVPAITKTGDNAYALTLLRGYTYNIAPYGGQDNNLYTKSVTYIREGSGPETATKITYTPGAESTKDFTIRITNPQAEYNIADREYTLHVTVQDPAAKPVFDHYEVTLNGEAVEVTKKSTYHTFPAMTQYDDLEIKAVMKDDDGKFTYAWTRGMGLSKKSMDGTGAEVKVDTASSRVADYWFNAEATNGNVTVALPQLRATKVTVLKLTTPEIVGQPVGASYIQGQTPAPLQVTVKKIDDNMTTMHYNWYRCDDQNRTNPVLVASPRDQNLDNLDRMVSYVPSTVEVGTNWFYCEVYHTKGDGAVESTRVLSDCVKIEVTKSDVTLEGQGTEQSPWLLKNQEDLNYLYKKVADGYAFAGMYFAFANDISLTADWKPIGVTKDGGVNTKKGTNILPFSGTLDGWNYTVRIAEGGKPLFNIVREATIKNLKIFGTKIDGFGLIDRYDVDYGDDGNYNTGCPATVDIDNCHILTGSNIRNSGFIGGYASGVNFVNISNCTVASGVTIGYGMDEYYASGFPATTGSFAGDFNGNMTNCSSAATVMGRYKVGGLVGRKGQSMGPCNIKNCTFTGKVVSEGDAGGILGSGYDDGTAPNSPCVTIEDCKCSGDITGKGWVGGILGREGEITQCWGNGIGGIQNNAFTGKVHGPQGKTGGIIGYMSALNKYNLVSNNYYASGCGAEKGIASVKYVDTSCATHETASGAIYFDTSKALPGITGVGFKNLNRTDDPLGKDAEKLCYTDKPGDGTNNGGTPATGDTGVLVWIIALPVTILAAAFVLKRKEREA